MNWNFQSFFCSIHFATVKLMIIFVNMRRIERIERTPKSSQGFSRCWLIKKSEEKELEEFCWKTRLIYLWVRYHLSNNNEKKKWKKNPIERERKFIIESKFVTISIQPKRGCLALHSLSWVSSFEIYIIFSSFLFCFVSTDFFSSIPKGERADESESEDFLLYMYEKS